jgi:lipopolysaccharide/colanic/teichoic acid biosynthesis glycosyltransferase
VLEVPVPVQTLGSRCAKRAMDIVGAFCLIVALSPLLALLALTVRTTSNGSALYKQPRVGQDGRLFTILKFRSMAAGSDGQLLALLAAQSCDSSPRFKVDKDPRITRVGAFLRRYSLDELPQLFNVLTGSMSLVGPRPQEPAEVALYRGDDGHRLGVRPGMTGLWQVSGRSRLSWEAARQLDVDYAHNWSIWGDLLILARTAHAVIGADGAKWGQ